MRIQGEVFGVEASSKTFRIATQELLGGRVGCGQRVVLYPADEAEELEEAAAEVGWWSELAKKPGVYRVTVREGEYEEGELSYSYTMLSDAASDPLAEERRVVVECEKALATQYPSCLLLLTAFEEPDYEGNLWEASLWQPDHDWMDAPTARGKTGGTAARALRASLEPAPKLVPETVEECAAEVHQIRNLGVLPEAVHCPGLIGPNRWHIHHSTSRYPAAETELAAWQAAVRALHEEASDAQR